MDAQILVASKIFQMLQIFFLFREYYSLKFRRCMDIEKKNG